MTMNMLDLSLLFIVKSINQPSDNFNILHYVSFSRENARSSSRMNGLFIQFVGLGCDDIFLDLEYTFVFTIFACIVWVFHHSCSV